MKKQKHAISPRREEDYPQWYQEVIKAADLAENAPVRGCMVIKPWGYGIWEKIQARLDQRIKARGVENAYFPLLIPTSLLEKEAGHIQGFAKECAVVTHSRLEEKDGQLVAAGELEEPLIIRPTSETIIGVCFSKWIQSHRDLPLQINQWANVMRWEMRTRLFLRTAEFLWQEGHTAHAFEEQAQERAKDCLEMYRDFVQSVLAIPVITGRKSELEKFPGAEVTYAFEAMMQDKKALQGGTSHYLGQNFSKAFDISFMNEEGTQQFAYTSSWGVTTRLIGALVMCHSDDDGLRLPPKIAAKHLVIIPFLTDKEKSDDVLKYAKTLCADIGQASFDGAPIEAFVDQRDLRGGEKNWDWIKKGIPLRLELGAKEIDANEVSVLRRDCGPKDRKKFKRDEFIHELPKILEEIQQNYFQEASDFLQQNINEEIGDFETMQAFFQPKNQEKPEIHGGFVKAGFCGSNTCEEKIHPFKVSVRCLLDEKSHDTCVICQGAAKETAIFAKSY